MSSWIINAKYERIHPQIKLGVCIQSPAIQPQNAVFVLSSTEAVPLLAACDIIRLIDGHRVCPKGLNEYECCKENQSRKLM